MSEIDPEPSLAPVLPAMRRYALALLLVAIAIALRVALTPLIGVLYPYLTLGFAVVFGALYLGVGPAVTATLSGSWATWYFIFPAPFSHTLHERTNVYGLVGFLLFVGFVIVLAEANRRAQSVAWDRADLLDLASDAIFEVSLADDKIRYWNEGAERLYGWSRAEAMNKNINSLLKPSLFHARTELRVLLALHGKWDGEFLHTRRDGTQVYVESRCRLQRSLLGESPTWLALNRDISDRKKSEREETLV
jgi:PAS domain S-box-containing protein